MVQACDGCGNAGKLRCSRCKSVHYCSAACQRNAWRGHRRACLAIAASLLSSAAAAPFEEVLKVPTRGAAGWTHFVIDGQDYLAVANFFTSRPGARPSMETTSVVYKAYATPSYATPSAAAGTKLRLEALQSFTTTGAHGVEHVAAADGSRFLVFPNYYGGDAVVLRWTGAKFEEIQRLAVDGGGNVVAFHILDRTFISIAEFNTGLVKVYGLRGGVFELWQTIKAPGCGSSTTHVIDGRLFLIAASYVTRETGWRTRSRVFVLNKAGTTFELYHTLPTIGAHGVAAIRAGDRDYLFFSNDKDERTTLQHSELFQWQSGKFVSVQKIKTDGAHAAELFRGLDGKHYLAVANLGDRTANTYRRDSSLYELDATADTNPHTLVQSLPTLGATDFKAFEMAGTTFLAVSNEQDDRLGGDVHSTIWALASPPADAHQGEL